MPRTKNDDAPEGQTYASATLTAGLHDLMPDPTPETVEEDFATRAQADEVEANLAAQQAIEAERANVPLELWRKMPKDLREQITMTGIKRKPTKMVELSEETLQAAEGGGANEMEHLLKAMQPPSDPTAYVTMCDPPVRAKVDGKVGIYHPGTSDISRKAIAKKRAAGFTFEPMYPFLPPASFACEMDDSAVYGLGGEPCVYRGRTQKEVDLHMELAHKREMVALTERRQRERDEAQIEAQRETAKAAQMQVELMRRTLEASEGKVA